jgi:hypothetical protein
MSDGAFFGDIFANTVGCSSHTMFQPIPSSRIRCSLRKSKACQQYVKIPTIYLKYTYKVHYVRRLSGAGRRQCSKDNWAIKIV